MYIDSVLRAVKFSLKFITDKKKRKLQELELAYRKAVNYFIGEIWEHPELGLKIALKNTRLTSRYVSDALWQAKDIVATTKAVSKTQKTPLIKPGYTGGLGISVQAMTFKEPTKTFDLVVAVVSAKRNYRIHLPVKKHRHFNRLMAIPGAKLKTGGTIKGNTLILHIELPDAPPKTEGEVIGVDIGLNKLLVDSNGKEYGKEIKSICRKIARRKPGSKGKWKARKHRDCYINETVNKLPWSEIKAIGVEDLTNLKLGKSPKRSREFRKILAPWSYRQVITKIELNSVSNRVQVLRVNPAYTSQTCPKCSKVSNDNRVNETFKCVGCGYTGDADYVGALNVMARAISSETLGSVGSPKLQNLPSN